MSLKELPEEILIMIFKKLDFKTCYSLYETCSYFRNIVCMCNIIKTCKLSQNTMATVKTLKLNFFKTISLHIEVLNLSGISKIKGTLLLTAMKKMKCLKTLDVSYTDITVVDLKDIFEVCPTIKNITCNFFFGNENAIISQKLLHETQNLFQNIENVNFVGQAAYLLYSNLALWVLQKAKLNVLQFTIAEKYGAFYAINENIELNVKVDNFKCFYIYMLNNWKLNHTAVYGLIILATMKLENYEFIVISQKDFLNQMVYVSSKKFETFFAENFKVIAKLTTNIKNYSIYGNTLVILWNKATTSFNDVFFIQLKTKMYKYFPYHLEHNNNESIPSTHDWFFTCLEPASYEVNHDIKYEPNLKKKRMGPESFILNYDNACKNKQRVELTLMFQNYLKSPVVLSSSCQYLRKLTYFSLAGTVKYSGEFFNVLFRCCDQLVTLNVEAPAISPCALSISRNIPLSQSLKNIRLVDKRIDFEVLFSSLSQCGQLENIHILDISSEFNKLSVPDTLFQKCNNLISLFILASMSSTAQAVQLQMLNKIKNRCGKDYVNIELYATHKENKYEYDPYVEVFKLSPIKPPEFFYIY